MPNLIQTYALQTGLNIGAPMPFEHFFPLPAEKYILVNPSSGMPSKNYDYFNEVLRLLRPLLPEYVFVQIGVKDDAPLQDTIHLQGVTTINHMMFLIRHCSMVIGNDSSALHIASSYAKPIVGLYGTTHPKIHGPHWGEKTKQRLLEPNRNGNKPTYSAQENPKTVNQIFPETVARAALEILDRDPAAITMSTIHIGGNFRALTLDLVCDQVIAPNEFQNMALNARLDYGFNEEFLFRNLVNRKLCIVTDKPVNVEPLKQLRQNIHMVAYVISEEYEVEFINKLRTGGIPYTIIANLSGDALAQAKLDFFDFGHVLPREKITKEKLENASKITTNTLYRSNRFILSKGKTYLNKLDQRNDLPCNGQRDNERPIIDHPDFWEDADYYHLYNHA